MQDEAKMPGQPPPHPRVPMGTVVIEDQVQRLLRRELPVQALKEPEELLMQWCL